jgi:putative Mg2+ transporter-C (MgtC) family protein
VNTFYMEINNLPNIALRLILAFIAGAIMGWERETDLPFSHRGSIFRLYALVCFGSCMFTITGLFGFSSDRIPSQVVSGVGFLGAGTILRDQNGIIRGLTTAAGIWVSASIGMMIGTGHFISGILGTCLAYIIMMLPHRFPRFFQRPYSESDKSKDTND